MTRLPAENWNVQGYDGPKYKVGPKCSVPDCNRWADHGHHIWRRSFLAGDYRWVLLWDETVVQNLTGLCYLHHEQVTGTDARIEYRSTVDRTGSFAWVSEVEDGGLLDPQPQTLIEFTGAPDTKRREYVYDSDDDACPTCGKRKKPKDELPPGPKRPRATWSVSVPKDERENGADVLDALELGCAEKLGREEHASHKYFVLAEVMAHFLQTPDYVGERVHEDDGA